MEIALALTECYHQLQLVALAPGQLAPGQHLGLQCQAKNLGLQSLAQHLGSLYPVVGEEEWAACLAVPTGLGSAVVVSHVSALPHWWLAALTGLPHWWLAVCCLVHQ